MFYVLCFVFYFLFFVFCFLFFSDGSRCIVTSSLVRPGNWHRFSNSTFKKIYYKYSMKNFSKYFKFKNIKYISSIIVFEKRWQELRISA